MASRTPSLKKVPGESWDTMAKATRKEMAGRTTSGILEKHRSEEEGRRGRKRDGVGAEERSGGRRPVRRCIISLCSLESGKQKMLKGRARSNRARSARQSEDGETKSRQTRAK